jgi:translocation and assembly module TamB
VEIAGSGRASGTVIGRLPQMSFEGGFSGSSVRYRGVRLGHVEARGLLNARAVLFEDLQARKDDAWFQGRGELTFSPMPPSNWVFSGEARGWPVEDIESLLTLPIWLEGKLHGDASLQSRDNQMSGEGTARVVTGSLRGRSFDRAESRLKLAGRQIVFESITASRGDGRVEGNLMFDLERDEFAGRFTAEDYAIAELGLDPLEADGLMNAEIRLAGSRERPSIELEANAPLLSISGVPLGKARLEALVQGETLDGDLRIRGEPFELDVRSQIRLSPDFPVSGSARWRDAELGSWMHSKIAGLPDSLRFFVDGEADFQGEFSSLARTLSADMTMNRVQLDVGDYQLITSAPAKMRILDGAVEMDGLPLAGEDTRLELSGRLPLDKGRLDVQARGAVNLQLFHNLFPSVSSSGAVDLSARATGTWANPSLSGQAEVTGGTLLFQGFPQALGDIHGRVFFDNRTVRFPDIRARFGGSPVTTSGTMVLRGLGFDSLELEVSGNQLRLRYPEGFDATLDADLALSGTAEAQVLSGRVDVQEATWSREYDLASGILVSEEADALEILVEMSEEVPFGNLSFDVEVSAPGTLRIRNSRASIDARAELELRGNFAHPALLGRTEALRGEVFLLGQRYRLISGRVDFVDPTTVEPFFELVAESRVRSYRIELRLSGTPDRFFPELSSDPPLRTVDILRLLSGASERDILIGSEEEELAGVGVASLLTERLTQEVGRRAERLFGLDRFSIDPFLVGQFTNPTARVSIGKQIYRDLSVSYSTNLNAATETLILIEYTPEGPINWIISRDEEGALGVDLRFRKSF